ncbi:hypothetical protein niasHT_027156 [Heterodera trifolii]|uniref:Uncharacterized protein n=1 Tax=Heterodera trifolii TaxID=157864 RepID=A0ABD2JVI8_9BILA
MGLKIDLNRAFGISTIRAVETKKDEFRRCKPRPTPFSLHNEVESKVCQEEAPDERKVPLHPWESSERPWQRIHIDFCGPFWGSMWLIIMDAKSKWPEVRMDFFDQLKKNLTDQNSDNSSSENEDNSEDKVPIDLMDVEQLPAPRRNSSNRSSHNSRPMLFFFTHTISNFVHQKQTPTERATISSSFCSTSIQNDKPFGTPLAQFCVHNDEQQSKMFDPLYVKLQQIKTAKKWHKNEEKYRGRPIIITNSFSMVVLQFHAHLQTLLKRTRQAAAMDCFCW